MCLFKVSYGCMHAICIQMGIYCIIKDINTFFLVHILQDCLPLHGGTIHFQWSILRYETWSTLYMPREPVHSCTVSSYVQYVQFLSILVSFLFLFFFCSYCVMHTAAFKHIFGLCELYVCCVPFW